MLAQLLLVGVQDDVLEPATALLVRRMANVHLTGAVLARRHGHEGAVRALDHFDSVDREPIIDGDFDERAEFASEMEYDVDIGDFHAGFLVHRSACGLGCRPRGSNGASGATHPARSASSAFSSRAGR